MFDTPWGIAIFVCLVILGTALLGFLLYMAWYALAGHILRYAILTRTKKTKWTHGSRAKNPVTEMIYETGAKWLEENKQYKKDLHTINDTALKGQLLPPAALTPPAHTSTLNWMTVPAIRA